MDTTYTDLKEGRRVDMTVEFVTRRVINCGDHTVYRLLVADGSGTQFQVLTTPDTEPPVGLRIGGTYRVTGLLGADPELPEDRHGRECPSCGGVLRPGAVLDAVDPVVGQAADRLGLDGRFGILDDRTSVRQTGRDRQSADNWTPMTDHGVDTPELVCVDCGQTLEDTAGKEVTATDLERLGDSVERGTDSGTGRSVPVPASTGETVAGSAESATTNFRANVANGYTPQPAAVRDEVLFSGYTVEAGDRVDSDGLFTPRCGVGASRHPITNETERYLSVGLDAQLPDAGFERPRLDLVVVLDVSASMDCPFDSYYHDRQSERDGAGTDASSKLDAAIQTVCTMAGCLRDEDRLGVVLCNHRAHVARSLDGVDDLSAVRQHVHEVQAGGGTDIARGVETAAGLFDCDPQEDGSERRVVVLSDGTSGGETAGRDTFQTLCADAAGRGVHTTLLGVGLDANPEVAAALTGVRGANYGFIPPGGVEGRVQQAFDCMVTPVVYDLTVELRANGYEVASVHGYPAAEAATDRLVHAGTLFPSIDDGSIHCGPILLGLDRTGGDSDPEVVVSWTERGGGKHRESVSVRIPRPGRYTDDGVRTAVALARYGRELRSWAGDCHDRVETTASTGEHAEPGRVPVGLVVSPESARRFDRLGSYLEQQMRHTGDRRLQRETDLLETLCRQAREAPPELAD
jgi:Ca-activated chloride channel family protein